ncbi:MAG: ACT domain-containing protein [Lachnospiraceae bacterium]|nr:ACT domain-containing protein [Lachnospiraceae bacterium]
MTVKQISVFLENSYGKLADIVDVLSGEGINLRAMSLAESQDFGIVRIIVDDYEKTSKILAEKSYVFSVKDVVAITIDDKPGSLAKVLRVLNDAQINMEYMYAFTAPANGAASLILKTADTESTADVLSKNGVCLLTQKDLSE